MTLEKNNQKDKYVDETSNKENDVVCRSNLNNSSTNKIHHHAEDGIIDRRGNPPLKILFLSSDTGGGHRASAEALAAQFQRLYPGSTYDLLDIVKEHGVPPYNGLEAWYQHLSKNPSQWNLVYKLSNSRAFESMMKVHLNLATERAVRRRIQSYDADVVISVHPLMTNVPVNSCAKISAETGRHLPFFTVVTDLGSGHWTWFDKGVEKMFIASDQIRTLAIDRGKVPEQKLVNSGLPIRFDFALEAERLGSGGRLSFTGKKYQQDVKKSFGITKGAVILVMGGGEGVGCLTEMVKELYLEMIKRKIYGTVVVICGRNESLRMELENYEWFKFLQKNEKRMESKAWVAQPTRACLDNPFKVFAKKTMHESNFLPAATDNNDTSFYDDEETFNMADELVSEQSHDRSSRNVTVLPLGFVSNIAQFMVASDILVTKAGPGTIAEAASVGLPVLLTSFLPGQEEGNVEYVISKGFGAFQGDSNPEAVASVVCNWLQDTSKLADMSRRAYQAGCPNAAEDIVKVIGKSVVRWKELNEEK